MNSYVSVEEEEVQCEDLDSLVLSASSIFGASVVAKSGSDNNFVGVANKDISSTQIHSNVSLANNLPFDIDDGKSKRSNVIKTRSKSIQKKGKNSKATNLNSKHFGIDPKLVSFDITENYENINSLDIECLPFETVLMNYPGQVDYFDLNDKFLSSESPNPFDSDQQSSSFDGFSESSNSSFEGFNESKPNSEKYIITEGVKIKNKDNSSKHSLVLKKGWPESECSPSSSDRPGLNKSTIVESEEIENQDCTNRIESTEFLHKGITSSVFGDHRVTPLTAKSRDYINSTRLKFDCQPGSLRSSPQSRPISLRSSPQSRPISFKDNEFSKSCQNYSKGTTSPICHSASSKFKEKANESGTMQQKSKKEKLTSHSFKNNEKETTISNYSINVEPNFKDIFSDDSDVDLMFEGFEQNLNNISSEIKNEQDIEEFIGLNCNKIGCTISWLESKQAKNPPEMVNNGVIFELSEFAKKIAWEPEFVADWICRLNGFLDIKVSDEDLRKINVVLKRRKAITVNFAGKLLLKSRMAAFESELFLLPSIENNEKNINQNIASSKITTTSNQKIQNNRNISRGKKVKNQNNLFDKTLENVSPILKATNNGNLKSVHSHSYNEGKNDGNSNKEQDLKMINYSDGEDSLFDPSDLEVSDTETSDFESNLYSKLDEKETSQRINSKLGNENRISGRVRKPTAKAQESDLEVSDTETSDFESNLYSKLDEKETSQSINSKLGNENRISGRVRKPTAKAQESYSIKSFGSTPQLQITPSPVKPKFLHPVFNDDDNDIGPHCKAAHIDVKLLNSNNEPSYPITKGVVYELYHFFRERKASLTSLVHTLYRLKNIPFDKSQIIATMAKIHEMVKVMWKENIEKNHNMPYEELDLLDFEISENKTKSQLLDTSIEEVEKNTREIVSEPLSKKPKYSTGMEPSEKESDSNSKSSMEPLKENNNSNKSFDLNSTKGCDGKITRGDIVYLYTKWLKKKMEGQSNVFVTDLSKDVEELIIDRKVECIRIPVGTLMSSSVKLFEEFRKLSKVNMYDAKTYLLEDWIEDIKYLLDSNGKKLEGNQDFKLHKKPNKSLSISKENLTSSKENDKESEMLVKKTIISSVSSEYEVEKIVGYRIVKIGEESITEYRIRWLGLTSKEDSWINEDDLNCPEILSKFWEALNRQRALKNKSEAVDNGSYKQSLGNSQPVKQQIVNDACQSTMEENELGNHSEESKDSSPTPVIHNTLSKEGKSLETLSKNQENLYPFFGNEKQYSEIFFKIMIGCLKADLVDYQHEEETSFLKRIKITKGEVLRLYDDWRLENQRQLLNGINSKVDVSVLVSKVKDLMASKKVRNFNPSSIIDACYRMSLMRAKLKEDNKIDEYLAGDFIELMQMSQKHQDFVRSENSEKLKKIKHIKSNGPNENDKLNSKINSINNLERESLIIAKYLDANKTKNIEKDLENSISCLKQKLHKNLIEQNVIEDIKKQNLNVIKDLETYGVSDDTLDEILNIATKIKT